MQASLQKLIWPVFSVLWTLIGVVHADEPSRADQIVRIERAMTAGADYLIREQQPDGMWKSRTYGLLKDGTALTPLVLWSLPRSAATDDARQRGLAVLTGWVNTKSRVIRIRVPLQSPVYAGGLTALVLHESPSQDPSSLWAWHGMVMQHQLNERNRWSESDPGFGGWGYGHDVPHKPKDGEPLSPLAEPNLSATVFALEALSCIADKTYTKAVRSDALKFVGQCQNWREDSAEMDRRFNDGGFHFMLADEVRNKAGVLGVDSRGETRFRSYGSATADGLRALRLCGLSADHPRVIAARNWLVEQFQDGTHSGAYAPDRTHLKPSLDFYYAHSVAHAFRQDRVAETPLSNGRWATVLASLLMSRQRQDGSWSNPAVDVREDDPLIATSFALRSLQECLAELRPPKSP